SMIDPRRSCPLLGGANRLSEVLNGKKQLSMTVQRLRARFGIPADLLLPERPATRRRWLAA
ncbi:hypothetical protein ABTK71_19520, partial [Acinetobacter baumannii]